MHRFRAYSDNPPTSTVGINDGFGIAVHWLPEAWADGAVATVNVSPHEQPVVEKSTPVRFKIIRQVSSGFVTQMAREAGIEMPLHCGGAWYEVIGD